jgi:methylated-DNA-[protein]-cysteine S-methyltransferase
MNAYLGTAPSPAGPVAFAVNEEGALVGLQFIEGRYARSLDEELTRDGYHLAYDEARTAHVRERLEEYATGARLDFDLPLAPRGTAWQQTVWLALTEIPCGETRSYAELAAMAGRPAAARAAGRANATNPIPLVIPCHRVIGADGSLTGYGGGLHIKEALLAHEARIAAAKAVTVEAR